MWIKRPTASPADTSGLAAPTGSAAFTIRARVLAVLIVATVAPAAASAVESDTCKRDLAETWSRMQTALARLKSVARASQDDKCAAYIFHADVVLRTREVLGRCRSGREREGDLAHMNGALDDVRSTISRECGAR
jgi:hypothetical protein